MGFEIYIFAYGQVSGVLNFIYRSKLIGRQTQLIYGRNYSSNLIGLKVIGPHD
jgi:hypothetical protein